MKKLLIDYINRVKNIKFEKLRAQKETEPAPPVSDEDISAALAYVNELFTEKPTTSGLKREEIEEGFSDETAINKNYIEHTLSQDGEGNPITYLTEHSDEVLKFVDSQLVEWTGLKLSIFIDAVIENQVQNKIDHQIFKTKYITILPSQADDYLTDLILSLSADIDEFTAKGSGWNKIALQVTNYKPIKGSSYLQLPKHFAAKKAIINIKNKDSLCFKYSVIAGLYPADKDAQRVTKCTPYLHLINDDGIAYPMPVCERAYMKFEEQNAISINVFSYKDKEIYPVYISKCNYTRIVDLFLIYKDCDDGSTSGLRPRAVKYHYALIKDLNRLLYSESKHKERKHFCRRCLQCFSREDVLTAHIPNCQVFNPLAIQMPESGTVLKFKEIKHQLKVPFIIYADFESLLVPIQGANMPPRLNEPSTRKNNMHQPSGFCFKTICIDPPKNGETVLFRGDGIVDVMVKFWEELNKEKARINRYLKNPAKNSSD